MNDAREDSFSPRGLTSVWHRRRHAVILAAASVLIVPGAALATTTEVGVGAYNAGATHMVPAVLAGLPLATLLGPAPATEELSIGVFAAAARSARVRPSSTTSCTTRRARCTTTSSRRRSSTSSS